MIHSRQGERRILHQRLQCPNRNVGQMLVVNRVVFRVFKEVHDVRHFKRDQRFRVRNGLQSGDQIAQVVNVREHVPAQDQIRRAPFGAQFSGGGSVEKFLARRDRRATATSQMLPAGSTPSTSQPCSLNFFRNTPVLWQSPEPWSPRRAAGREQVRHHLVQMRVHRLGRGRDVGVVRIKNFRVHRVGELHQRAIRAKHHAQRQRDVVVFASSG